MQPITKWPASALPVADAVSFEFDGVNVTSQHVMIQTAPLISWAILWWPPARLLRPVYQRLSW